MNWIKKDVFSKFEKELINYLNKQLGMNFVHYSHKNYKHIFGSDSLVYGKPDGLEIDEYGNIISILEIKSSTSAVFEVDCVYSSYLMQLASYLYLSGLSVGYLCVCSTKSSNLIKYHLNLGSNLIERQIKNKQISKKIKSWIPSIGYIDLNYEIFSVYSTKKSDHFNEVILWKIKIDMPSFIKGLKKASRWMSEHERLSPPLNPREVKWLKRRFFKTKF